MPAPSNPAPVGLPGALSQRTDGGPADRQPMRRIPDAAYGEQQDFQQIQQGAPMAADPGIPPMQAPTGLFAPSERPDEPVTSGIASGPGDGPEPVSFDQLNQQDTSMVRKYLPALRRASSMQGAPDTFKAFVHYLESFDA
jgi:hypothetical protein